MLAHIEGATAVPLGASGHLAMPQMWARSAVTLATGKAVRHGTAAVPAESLALAETCLEHYVGCVCLLRASLRCGFRWHMPHSDRICVGVSMRV